MSEEYEAATPDETSSEGGSALSRREYVLGAGGLGVLALGGGGLYETMNRDAPSGGRPDSYVVQQGYLRWEVTPLSHGGQTVEEFYDYQSSSSSANPLVDLAEDPGASRLFVYDGPVGSSLVFLHGSPRADHGGTAFLKFSGLSRSKGEWAVRDDPMGSDDDFETWEGGNAKVKWQWDAGETDGGAYWGVGDGSSAITVTPKTLRNVDAWRFLSGESGSTSFDLSTEKPVKIRPGEERSVERANVEIMPSDDPNTFDPYEKGDVTVVIRSPPEGADKSEWVTPSGVDPGNYSVYFGSRDYLAGQNGASPQKYIRRGGDLYLKYKIESAHFSLDSARGFLVGKTGSYTWFRGSDTVRPGDFGNTETGPSLAVTDTNVDPAGGDAEHLAKEYVEFTNEGSAPFDMTDYTVTDAEGWKFHFPDDFTLDAGASVRLHTGSGRWDEDDLYWGLDRPVWDNDGDTITVTDADGNEVLRRTY
ncbi:competence-like protein [Halarchaeum acidiphilum MH1-52-1]|uniref:Competence-like protein n=1 Tax=Halarchaeum acidiphilum MH1-52-1 TaxID=1261545 RepID=U3AEN0_9EURY|nr:lamin tail domain-containing protein [Halarchaeum acidiphilum]GAD53233.1 competence-like protein [Halarchaeum acidiphilum MH1-52-1]